MGLVAVATTTMVVVVVAAAVVIWRGGRWVAHVQAFVEPLLYACCAHYAAVRTLTV